MLLVFPENVLAFKGFSLQICAKSSRICKFLRRLSNAFASVIFSPHSHKRLIHYFYPHIHVKSSCICKFYPCLQKYLAIANQTLNLSKMSLHLLVLLHVFIKCAHILLILTRSCVCKVLTRLHEIFTITGFSTNNFISQSYKMLSHSISGKTDEWESCLCMRGKNNDLQVSHVLPSLSLLYLVMKRTMSL